MKFSENQLRIVHARGTERVLDGIASNAEDSYEYIQFLIKNSYPIPQKFIDAVKSDKNKAIKIAIALKKSGKKVQPDLLEPVVASLNGSLDYLIAAFESGDKKVEPEIIHNVASNVDTCTNYFQKMIRDKDSVLPAFDELIDKVEYADLSLDLAKYLIRFRKYEYSDLNPKLIENIFKNASCTKEFAHFLDKYVPNFELPEEIQQKLDEIDADHKKEWSKKKEIEIEKPISFNDFWNRKKK